MHFVVGYSMITNDSIISSEDLLDSDTFSLDDATGINLFDQKRYQTYHAQVFFVLSVILICTSKGIVESKLVFGDSIENFFISKFATNGTVEDDTSISDDYYELMSAKFLINELERTRVYLDRLNTFSDERWDVVTQRERMENKISVIEEKISGACNLIKDKVEGGDESVPGDIKGKIDWLLDHLAIY